MKNVHAKQRIDNSLISASGLYFVVSELCLRGLVALPTVGNTPWVDVLVASIDGTWHANLQVKASRNKVSFWPVGIRFNEWQGKNTFYAFVRYLKKESRFEVFLESSKIVAKQIAHRLEEDKKNGKAEWQPSWFLPKDEKNLSRLRKQWQEFGRDSSV